MFNPGDKVERSLFKLLLWLVGIVVLIIVLATSGHRFYRHWQQRRLVTQANALIDQGDMRRAALNARRLLQIAPNDPDGSRVMARLAEKGGVRSVVDWRRRVVDLGGASTSDIFALAHAAMRYDEIGTADYALGKLPEAAKSTAEYHALAAELAMARGEIAQADAELQQAVKLEPANQQYTLRLAAIHLAARDGTVATSARTTLTALQKEPSVRREATRVLLDAAVRQQDSTGALALARQLQEAPDATFADRVVYLEALQRAYDPAAGDYLAKLQAEAAAKPDETARLITWMNAHGKVQAALDWSKTLPPELLAKRPVPLALADAYLIQHDWAGLQALVKKAQWGDLEFLRLALLARALRETGFKVDSERQWDAAVKKTADHSDAVMMLANTAQDWGWRKEMADLLWLAAKDPTKADAALHTLYAASIKAGDTEGLYRALLHFLELRPDDRNVQNNLAQMSLLLGLNVDRGQKMARELYEKEPSNPAYVSTYAFALYTRGESKKAAQVLGALTPEQLREPAVAAYYGVILAAAGDRARASEFLELGAKATLLPEEKALLEKARRSVSGS